VLSVSVNRIFERIAMAMPGKSPSTSRNLALRQLLPFDCRCDWLVSAQSDML
jgi:hypothetical protein